MAPSRRHDDTCTRAGQVRAQVGAALATELHAERLLAPHAGQAAAKAVPHSPQTLLVSKTPTRTKKKKNDVLLWTAWG